MRVDTGHLNVIPAVLMNIPTILLSAGHKPPPLVDIDGTIFVQFGIFIVLLFFLTKFVFRPYFHLLRERTDNIDGAKQEAERENTEADEKMSTYEDQILKTRKEAASIRAELRKEGELKATSVLATARIESEKKLNAAREKLEKSSQAAQLSLRTRADQIAKVVAHKLLGREV